MKKELFLLILPFICLACQGNQASEVEAETPAAIEIQDETTVGEDETTPSDTDFWAKFEQIRRENNLPFFKAAVDDFKVRATPDLKGKELTRVKEGADLEYLGEVSKDLTKVTLRGFAYDEPWLKVKVNGQEGWVFSGGVIFDDRAYPDLAKKLLYPRYKTLLGPTVKGKIVNSNHAFEDAKTERDFYTAYRKLQELGEEIDLALENRDPLENRLSWIGAGITGLEVSIVAEGTTFASFIDFNDLAAPAKRTTGTADDDFVLLARHLYANEYNGGGVEDPFAVYFLQTWDYGGNSLLGQGFHNQLLLEMSEVLSKSKLFEKEILECKERLVQDILKAEKIDGQDNSLANVHKELDAILNARYSVLAPEDIQSIEVRRKEKFELENYE